MLKELVSKLYQKLGPDLKVDKDNKIVEMEEKYFFSNITETYYVFQGYEVKRI